MRRIMLLTIVVGLLLVQGVGAAELKADTDAQDVRATILKSAAGWSTLNPDNNDPIYTSSDRAVFFDVAPMQYVGWAAYKEGFRKGFAGFKDMKLALNDDLAVHRAGNLAWATTTWKLDGHLKDGKDVHLEGRTTLLLEKQNGKWVIVHEHYSVPAQM